MAYETTYHRDGTVTVWHVYQQVWRRMAADEVSAETLATLTDSERRRIARMALRLGGIGRPTPAQVEAYSPR